MNMNILSLNEKSARGKTIGTTGRIDVIVMVVEETGIHYSLGYGAQYKKINHLIYDGLSLVGF
ncbi:hypothetical protein [Niallia sp. Krafla_26]|uniref:hypothetical protein n=1 Tax=Niallia sp. Krafla_26 TaxID=3064703 RepID=UPI003D1636B3